MARVPKRRLLVTGVPGTGKTKVGDFLAARHGFLHVDLEDDDTRARFFGRTGDRNRFARELAKVISQKKPIIVTWGFVPNDPQLGLVLFLRSQGFEWIWLDGDREASHEAFTRRGDVPEQVYQNQMMGIELQLDPRLASLGPRIVNPFSEGSFRPVEEIAEELKRR
jgi:shikimate kinase